MIADTLVAVMEELNIHHAPSSGVNEVYKAFRLSIDALYPSKVARIIDDDDSDVENIYAGLWLP